MGRFHCLESKCATVWVKEKSDDDDNPLRRYKWTKQNGAYDFVVAKSYNSQYVEACEIKTEHFPVPFPADSGLRYYRGRYKIHGTASSSGQYIQSEELELEAAAIIYDLNDVWQNYLIIYTGENSACTHQNFAPSIYTGNSNDTHFYGTPWVQAIRVDRSFAPSSQWELSFYDGSEKVATVTDDHPIAVSVDRTLGGSGDIWRQIKVEKFPYFERLEIVPFAYEKFGFNLVQKSIPNECLNIYVNDVTGAVTVPNIPYPANPFYDSWQFITQICSLPGEPPPEYRVICNCDEEKCPPGTCEVDCGNSICCDGSDGIAVKEIKRR